MGSWTASSLALNGAELNIQEALTAIDRVLRDDQIEAHTRSILEAACSELRRETA